MKSLLTGLLLTVVAMPSIAGSTMNATVKPQLNSADSRVFQKALSELSGTKLQFNCASDEYTIQKIFKPKPASSLPVVTYNESNELVNVSPVGSYACPESEISLERFCVQVLCTYTEVLSQEEAHKRVAEEQAKQEAADRLLNGGF